MARTTPEWIAKSDDSAIPDRVKLRIFMRDRGRCCKCTRGVGLGAPFQYDHRVALINGGTHSESNIWLLCEDCHTGKTKADLAEKSITYRKRLKHHGLKKPKGRPIPGSKRSGLKKLFSGKVVRREK